MLGRVGIGIRVGRVGVGTRVRESWDWNKGLESWVLGLRWGAVWVALHCEKLGLELELGLRRVEAGVGEHLGWECS